jgi:hypothetical protein
MKLSLFALPIVLVTLAGCSKPSPEDQKKQEAALAAAFASALSAPSASATGAATAAAAAPGGISATCDNKSDGKCTETMGAAGLGAEDSCTRLGGKYTKAATPCSHENLVGSCARSDATSGLADVDYFYKGSGNEPNSLKSLCEGVMSGKWTPAPKSAAPPAKPAAKGKK